MGMGKKDKQGLKRLTGEDEETGTDGQTGTVEFRYHNTLSTGPRDDALPETEINRLLTVHAAGQKERVDKQKATRKERDDIKNGRVTTYNYDSLGLRQGGSGGGSSVSPYKTHRISDYAQFSGGTDRKVTGVPSDNLSETNDDMKQDLLNELELRPKYTPAFNPRPRPS